MTGTGDPANPKLLWRTRAFRKDQIRTNPKNTTSRAVHVAGICIDPDGAWMMQVARNLLDAVDGFLGNATQLMYYRAMTTQCVIQLSASRASVGASRLKLSRVPIDIASKG